MTERSAPFSSSLEIVVKVESAVDGAIDGARVTV